MSDAPAMNWHIPSSPENINVVRVPPVAVEVSVSELQNFTEQIEEGVERQVESAQPDEVIWDLKILLRLNFSISSA